MLDLWDIFQGGLEPPAKLPVWIACAGGEAGRLPFDSAEARIGHWIFGKSSANLCIQLLVWGLALGGVEL